MACLRDDPDSDLAAIGRDAQRRIDENQQRRESRKEPAKVPVQRFSATTFAGYGPIQAAKDDAASVAPLRPDEVLALSDFDAMWRLLGERPLPWQSYRDQQGWFTAEGDSHMEFLAEQAQSENAEIARPILEKLRATCGPQHRPVLIASLKHPLLGKWASWLLLGMPPGRDVLTAFRDGEEVADLAASVTLRWGMRAETVEALIEAGRDGLLPPPTYFGANRPPVLPAWLRIVEKVDGLEGLARVLRDPTPAALRKPILDYIAGEKLDQLVGDESPPARLFRRWVREQVTDSADDLPAMLRILRAVGDFDDANRWAARLESRGELADPVALAATELVARLGTAAHLPLLMRLLYDQSTPIAQAAISGIGRLGGEAEAAVLLNELVAVISAQREHDRKVHEEFEQRQRERQVGDGASLGLVVQESPVYAHPGRDEEEREWNLRWWSTVPVVTTIGSRDAVRRLAFELLGPMMVDDWRRFSYHGALNEAAIAAGFAAIDAGRFPEHALFALAPFPSEGSSYVVPASVTGGGDEVFDDDGPDRSAEVLAALEKRVGKDGERAAFLDFALTFSSADALEYVERFGDVKREDAQRILQELTARPGDAIALDCLRRTRTGEPQLAGLWRGSGLWTQ